MAPDGFSWDVLTALIFPLERKLRGLEGLRVEWELAMVEFIKLNGREQKDEPQELSWRLPILMMIC